MRGSKLEILGRSKLLSLRVGPPRPTHAVNSFSFGNVEKKKKYALEN